MLKWISKKYSNPKVIITENGYSDFNGTLNDEKTRVKYITVSILIIRSIFKLMFIVNSVIAF